MKSAGDALSVGIETDKAPCGTYLEQCDHRTKSTMVAKPPHERGIRPINNVVDAPTTSCSTGQPMHAFDLDYL